MKESRGEGGYRGEMGKGRGEMKRRERIGEGG